MQKSDFVVLIFAAMLNLVHGYVQCGKKLCYGTTAQCCSWDINECCWFSWYTLWWIWVGAILIMAVLFSIFICCFRNRRRRHGSTRHIVVVPATYQTYGSFQPYHQDQRNYRNVSGIYYEDQSCKANTSKV